MEKFVQSICLSCDPRHFKPGQIIEVTRDGRCESCGRSVIDINDREVKVESLPNKRWDQYFHGICSMVSTKSSCLSRKIGAILVKDHSILSTGYNGPPRGVPHCGHDRLIADKDLAEKFEPVSGGIFRHRVNGECPRKLLGYESGTHMELCPAQHAEGNTVSNAARHGIAIKDSTLYINRDIPCQKCFGTLINAGIAEIVIEEAKVYGEHTQFLIDNSSIKIREFEL